MKIAARAMTTSATETVMLTLRQPRKLMLLFGLKTSIA
jgi:hypothetical protein